MMDSDKWVLTERLTQAESELLQRNLEIAVGRTENARLVRERDEVQRQLQDRQAHINCMVKANESLTEKRDAAIAERDDWNFKAAKLMTERDAAKAEADKWQAVWAKDVAGFLREREAELLRRDERIKDLAKRWSHYKDVNEIVNVASSILALLEQPNEESALDVLARLEQHAGAVFDDKEEMVRSDMAKLRTFLEKTK